MIHDLHFLAAQRKHLNGEWAEAETLYLEIVNSGRNVAQARHYLGFLLLQTGRLEDAREQLRQAIALECGHAEWHFNLGIVHSRLGELAEAVEAHTCAVALDPKRYFFWTNLGAAQDACGDAVNAEDSFNRAILIEPSCPDAYFLMSALLLKEKRFAEGQRFNCLGIVSAPAQCTSRIVLSQAYHELGRPAEAIDVLLQWEREEPDNPIPTHLLTAHRAEAGKAPEQCAAGYVERTFDDFAGRFDDVLAHLEYAGPQLVGNWLAAQDLPPASQCILDLGCGTGLVGEVLRSPAARLVGVDLSEAMLQKARERHCYDVLHRADMKAFLEVQDERFDLAACMDVLTYLGSLDDLMVLIGQSLKPGGLLIFCTEKLASARDGRFRLNVSGRYRHCEEYLRAVLDGAGFAIELIQDVVIRNESGCPVAGQFVCARRTE